MTPSNSPSPYKQLLPLTHPCFKMFLERSLNDPSLHPTSSIPHCYPLPIHHPFPPPKNFDHTPEQTSLEISTSQNQLPDRFPVRFFSWEIWHFMQGSLNPIHAGISKPRSGLKESPLTQLPFTWTKPNFVWANTILWKVLLQNFKCFG